MNTANVGAALQTAKLIKDATIGMLGRPRGVQIPARQGDEQNGVCIDRELEYPVFSGLHARNYYANSNDCFVTWWGKRL